MRVKIIEREKQIELEEKRLRVVKSNTMQKLRKADADRYVVEQSAEAEKVKQIKRQMRINIRLKLKRARAENVWKV